MAPKKYDFSPAAWGRLSLLLIWWNAGFAWSRTTRTHTHVCSWPDSPNIYAWYCGNSVEVAMIYEATLKRKYFWGTSNATSKHWNRLAWSCKHFHASGLKRNIFLNSHATSNIESGLHRKIFLINDATSLAKVKEFSVARKTAILFFIQTLVQNTLMEKDILQLDWSLFYFHVTEGPLAMHFWREKMHLNRALFYL